MLLQVFFKLKSALRWFRSCCKAAPYPIFFSVFFSFRLKKVSSILPPPLKCQEESCNLSEILKLKRNNPKKTKKPENFPLDSVKIKKLKRRVA